MSSESEPPPFAGTRPRGLFLVLGATAVSGVFAYLIQLSAPRLLGAASDYVSFSVYWSTLFLFGSAIAGVQQEIARSTRLAQVQFNGSPLRRFVLAAMAAVLLGGAIACLVIWPSAFSLSPIWMSAWFVIGLAGYFLFAVLSGVLYGTHRLRAVAVLMTLDAVLRGIAVTVGFILGVPPGGVAALVSLPFGAAVVAVWVCVRSSLVGRIVLDAAPRRLAINAVGTVIGASATALMVSGLPLLLRATMPGADDVVLASMILAITLTRAPFIVPLLALQSYLIVDFRTAGRGLWRRVAFLMAALSLLAGLCSVAAWLWGPAVIGLISAGRFALSGEFMLLVTLSAGLVGLMCISGPALLSDQRHRTYVVGWLTAAGATIVCLLVPMDPVAATVLALLLPPALGLAVHLLGIRRPSSSERGSFRRDS